METKETSDSKMVEFMMDGAIFTITRTIIGTVRQVFIRFSDGRSGKGSVQEQLYLEVNIEPCPSECSAIRLFRLFVTPIYRTLLVLFVMKYMYPFPSIPIIMR